MNTTAKQLTVFLENNTPQVWETLIIACQEQGRACVLVGAILIGIGLYGGFLLCRRQWGDDYQGSQKEIQILVVTSLSLLFGALEVANGLHKIMAPTACAVGKLTQR
jgi:hypothetical protein